MTDPKIRLKVLQKRWTSNADDIQAIVVLARDMKSDTEKVNLFKGMYRTLESSYKAFIDAWEAIEELRIVNETTLSPTTTKELDFVNSVKKYRQECHSHMAALEASAASANYTLSTNASSSQGNQTVIIKNKAPTLSTVQIPHFSGVVTDWPNFKSLYEALVHNDGTLSNAEKYHYLRHYLKGEAEALIKHIPFGEAHYQTAYQELLDEYDGKRKLARAYLTNILNFKPLNSEPSTKQLKEFIAVMSDNQAAFKQLNIPRPSSYIFFELAIRLLDRETRRRFERSKTENEEFPDFSTLVDFIKEEYRARDISDSVGPTPSSSTSSDQHKGQKKGNSKFSLLASKEPSFDNQPTDVTRSPSCLICNQNHKLIRCPTFEKCSPKQRKELLKSKNFNGCWNCLYLHRHANGKCSSIPCRICSKAHHTSLHFDSKPSNVTCIASSEDRGLVLLATVLLQARRGDGSLRVVRGILDSASQGCLISECCASQLGLEPYPSLHSIRGLAFNQVTSSSQVDCIVQPCFSSCPTIRFSAVIVPSICQNLPQTPVPSEIINKYRGCFQLADHTFGQSGPIDLLIGADVYASVVKGPPIQLESSGPSLIDTINGYTVIGPVLPSPSNPVCLLTVEEPNLSKFWEIEEVEPPKSNLSQSDQLCEEHFCATTSRSSTGRYIVRFPFKKPIESLGNSKQQALRRFEALEKRLISNPVLHLKYSEFMTEYEQLGHMRLVEQEGKHYIPHHAVTKGEGADLKIRVVFDGSAPLKGGSFNSYLYTGPNLLPDLRIILLNFRRYPVAFTTDIVKFFRQVLIDPRDRTYQHIFWRRNPSEEIRDFELVSVTYGLGSSPYHATRALRQLALDEGSSFPQAKIILENFCYVDDVLCGASSESEAVSLKHELVHLLRKGGFELSKWHSNCPSILTDISTSDSTTTIDLCPDSDSVKVLGMHWDPALDVFRYKTITPHREATKRGILSTISRLYDPLGYLSPVVVLAAKIMMQDIWKQAVQWDDAVPQDIKQRWDVLLYQFHHLADISIPRFVPMNIHESTFLAGFCDASGVGYCAMIYLCTPAHTYTYLLVAKTKVAPLKVISVNRLELCAALLLTRLLSFVTKVIDSRTVANTWMFSDSTTVLSWIRQDPAHLKIFVGHRVSVIQESTPIESWRYVPTHDNPADIGSRGSLPENLKHHSIWWSGPSWLLQPEESWPAFPKLRSPVDLPELRRSIPKTSLIIVKHSEEFISFIVNWMERFSNFGRLVRSMAYVLRLVRNRHRNSSTTISALEFENSRTHLIRLVQQSYFTKSTKTSNIFNSLNVFTDELGVLRVGGRIRHAETSEEQRHPILLHKHAHFTKLIVLDYHQRHIHLGTNALQSLVQLTYWIPGLRNLIRKIQHSCTTCRRFKKRPLNPYMGDLPKLRFSQVRAFYKSGVDFAGPFNCKESPRRNARSHKVYLCLFVCLSTKAVHLEVANDLSTPAFLQCFDRFTARRGLPSTIISDCGTNFVGARSYLRDLTKWFTEEATQTDISGHTADLGIEWIFIPPASPHFGGLWEAGVKSVKTLLRKLFGDHSFTLVELITAFAKIEALLNSRPLTPLSTDPNDLEPLTPGHFLVGAPLVSLPERDQTEIPENRLRRWELLQRLTQQFWRRWRLEYFHTLQQRTKWTNKEAYNNLQPGDLVLLRDASNQPGRWPMARVIEIHSGGDGIVRVVTVKTAMGHLKRPVVKLVKISD